MLLQAVQDAMSISNGRRHSALRWMSSRNEDPYSFLFVCRVVDRDPDEVRHFCKHQMAQRQELQWQGASVQWQVSHQAYAASAA